MSNTNDQFKAILVRNEIPQFLTNFKNSKIPNGKISFDRYLWHGYSKIPQEKRIAKIKEQMNEEIKINPSFCNYRVDSEQNRKISEIAEGLKSGKIIGKKIISNAFDLNLQDLLGQLKTQAFPLSDIITNAINQKEGVALDYALINDIKHNLLDNTFHFIFDIDLHLIDD
ncbi:hypothetical protein [Helicobacter pylori]|uniref:hypothetical protein n=1 Tax=Helicobacter pylori TaxID=210 RepID=UPI001E341927|nr:hypothetical protein [Helicobacter pylori]